MPQTLIFVGVIKVTSSEGGITHMTFYKTD